MIVWCCLAWASPCTCFIKVRLHRNAQTQRTGVQLLIAYLVTTVHREREHIWVILKGAGKKGQVS